MNRKGILIILDGYGEGKDGKFNAVKNANNTFFALYQTKVSNDTYLYAWKIRWIRR